MKLVVGLGNPEEKYFNSRHNIGFMFVDALKAKLGYTGYRCTEWKREELFYADYCVCRNDLGKELLLAKPTTYMNLSGNAVQVLLAKHDVRVPEEFFVAYDDLDIKGGCFKFSVAKSPRQHNGVIDIVRKIGRDDFTHIRIGVDQRPAGKARIPGMDYVLMKIKDDERIELDEAIATAIEEFVKKL